MSGYLGGSYCGLGKPGHTMKLRATSVIDVAAQILDPVAFQLVPGGHPEQAERAQRRRQARVLAAKVVNSINEFSAEETRRRNAAAIYSRITGKRLDKPLRGLSADELERKIEELQGDEWRASDELR